MIVSCLAQSSGLSQAVSLLSHSQAMSESLNALSWLAYDGPSCGEQWGAVGRALPFHNQREAGQVTGQSSRAWHWTGLQGRAAAEGSKAAGQERRGSRVFAVW